MSLYIKTHIVKKGETLEDIVLQYDISDVEILRYFHNHNAPKDSNHIGSIVFVGQEIFIPEKADIEKLLEERAILKEVNKSIDKEILRNRVLLPNFFGFDAQYTVKLTHYIENKLEERESLSFTVFIKYIGTTKEGFPILQYQKKFYNINGQELKSKLYKLAVQRTDFLYPLEFSLDEVSKPYKIVNLREIVSRWEKLKDKLRNTFIDSYSENYTECMDGAMEQGLQKYIMRDLFIQFFFAPYKEYTKGRSNTQNLFHNYRI